MCKVMVYLKRFDHFFFTEVYIQNENIKKNAQI